MSEIDKVKKTWEEIVSITEQCKYEECVGLRQVLFLDAQKKAPSLIIFLVNLLKSLSVLIFIKKRLNLITTYVNQPILFYIPFNTTAMKGNLLPVYQECQKAKYDCLLVAPQSMRDVKVEILKEDLVKFIGFFSKLKLLLISIRATNNLMKLLAKKQNKSWKLYSKYLYNVFIIFLSENVWNMVLSATNPKAIVSTSDYFPRDYALFSQANKLNIPNYLIQHGIIGISYHPFTAKKMFVYGVLSKAELVAKGCPEEKLIVGGMPSSDMDFQKTFHMSNNEIHKEIYENKLLILSDTQGQVIYPEVYNDYKNYLKNLLIFNPHMQFVIKLHPAESEEFYTAISDKFPNLLVLPKSTTLTESFKLSGFVATIWSTAGIDAMKHGIPLIVLDVNPSVKYYASWPLQGGGRYISNLVAEDFKLHLSEALNKDMLAEQRRFLDLYFTNKGFASSCIFNRINSNEQDTN